jgi:probable phosphoglycerate mutase
VGNERGELVLVRHGRTAWSASGRHTGRTDVPLDDEGRAVAEGLRERLARRRFAAVRVSPLARARRTADLAGLRPLTEDPDLVEWDYGGYEGLTTPEVRELRGGDDWRVVTDGVVPGQTPGETIEQVAARCDAVLARVTPTLDAGDDVALVGHGHALRVLGARWLGLDPRTAAHLELGTAGVSVLGAHHDVPTLRAWNLTSGLV